MLTSGAVFKALPSRGAVVGIVGLSRRRQTGAHTAGSRLLMPSRPVLMPARPVPSSSEEDTLRRRRLDERLEVANSTELIRRAEWGDR
jgi:hypothetical protein